MATTAAPYGLKPVKRADGMSYAGATSQYLIDPAGEATNLFTGQVVIIGADGYLALSTATGADITTNNLGGSGVGAIGVFMGCEYVNAQGQLEAARLQDSAADRNYMREADPRMPMQTDNRSKTSFGTG